MTSDEMDWDIVDEVEWGNDEEIDWEEVDTEEEILLELRNDPQPSFFVRKFAVVWWKNGFYKAGKIDGTIRVTPTKFLLLDTKGKLRISIDKDKISSITLHEHDGEFPIFYNEITTDDDYLYQITVGVDEAQSKQNHKDIKAAINDEYDAPKPDVKELRIVTSNNGKIKEFTQAFDKLPYHPVKISVDYPEIQASTLEEVVDFGLDWLKGKVQPPFIIDDAGVFIEALDDFPGVYSRYIFDTIGLEGVLKQMKEVKNRKTTFKCVLGLLLEDGTKHKFVGECHGELTAKPKGKHGFGYDPIFIPQNLEKTFAELNSKAKNQLSHRGLAMAKLLDFIKKGKL